MSPQRTSSRKCCTARFSMNPRHMMAWSSPAPSMEPIDTILSRPGPMGFSRGANRARPDSSFDPALDAQHAGNIKPADVGVEHANRQPPLRQHDGEVGGDRRLADPALPEAMATVRAVVGMSVFSAFSRAFHRTWAMRLLFCSTVISPKWTRTSATSGRLATRSFTSFIIWARSGQPTGRGQGDGDVHVAALAVDVDAVDHAQVDHVVAQLGVDHPPQGVPDGLIGHDGGGHHVPIYFLAFS